MKITSFPARIHILFARQADSALIIRRGPSKKVCTIGWDRSTNTFTLGQWLSGRIYEERCDLSPDGRHFIYFALNGKWGSQTGGTWTAISRTPYLKAIGLWGKGDTWGGGGSFISNTEYCIRDYYDSHQVILKPDNLTETNEKPNCGGHYYHFRLTRDGWTFINRQRKDKETDIATFERKIHPAWMLRKICTSTSKEHLGKACYYDQHQLVSVAQEQVLDYPDWEWADADKRGLYWAQNGKLYHAQLDTGGLINIAELYDFNCMKFEKIKAPY
jgi:hypothetical protein